jgi:hypothetical protein
MQLVANALYICFLFTQKSSYRFLSRKKSRNNKWYKYIGSLWFFGTFNTKCKYLSLRLINPIENLRNLTRTITENGSEGIIKEPTTVRI